MQTEVIQINPQIPEEEKIKQAARIINKGGLVVIPTETVYGIAANMLNGKTIEQLYTLKKRPKDKPFSLHISAKVEAEKYAIDILPFAFRLMEKFWPGPITLVLKSKQNNKIGMRMPNHKVAVAIIQEAACPVVCPSANLSGNSAPTTVQEVLNDLDGLVDLVVDTGKTTLGKESTVVDATQLPIQILREGAITEDKIQEVVNHKVVLFVCTGNSCRSVMAKGLLEKKLKEKNRQNMEVLSAGMMMLDGLRVTDQTKELLAQEGIDVSYHRSQGINKDMLKKADLILVMEKNHEEKILQLVPEAKFRLFLLKEFAKIEDNNLEIVDPIGRNMEFYEQTFSVIKQAIERIAEII